METLRCLICGYHEILEDEFEKDECPECGSEDIYYSEDISQSFLNDDDLIFEDDIDEIDYDFDKQVNER